MTAAETTKSRFDSMKLGLGALLILAGMGAFYYYADELILLYRVLILLGAVVLSAVIFYQTAAGKSIWVYLQDARTELRKVVWPTRAETLQTTLLVSVVVIIAGFGLWGLDLLFGWMVRGLLSL